MLMKNVNVSNWIIGMRKVCVGELWFALYFIEYDSGIIFLCWTGLCDEDNSTQCVQGQKYPDRSNCSLYYLCNGGFFIIQTCGSLVFDIDVGDCIIPDSSFNCDYRCRTSAPTNFESTSAMTSSGTTQLFTDTETSVEETIETTLTTSQSTTVTSPETTQLPTETQTVASTSPTGCYYRCIE